MKYSTKLSDTIHILIFIALGDDEQLSSTKIAESIKTNPAYVRQLMATLKNAGIVVNTQGHANAALAKSADKINMYDIYRAVEGDKPLLHLDTDTNPDCGIGINIQFAIGDFYHEIQNMANASKASVAKHASPEEYRASTGFECLLGWLYLNGQLSRVHELFETLWQSFDPNEK